MRNILFGMLALCLFAGCGGGGEVIITDRDKLNGEELTRVISSARLYASTTKELKLSPEELDFVNSNEPSTRIAYKARKSGRIVMSWQVTNLKELQVIRVGDLLDEGCAWTSKVIKSEVAYPKSGETAVLPLGGNTPKTPASALPEKSVPGVPLRK